MSAGLHSGDGPVVDPADDVLGRYEFASALADDVRLAPAESGFVIGLNGPWGSGKTSVLRLTGYAVRDEVSAVVSFNPWLFSGTEQLVSHFFAELSGQLERSSGRARSVAKAISSYGRVISPLRYMPYVGEFARIGADVAQALGSATQAEAQSAEVQAEKLKEKLAELEKPILVLVDDLDRLRPEEIVDVVRLVRLVGDFPNLVYVVAFDQEVVEEALSQNGGDGRAYLEKIIHISHALPPIRHEDLTSVLQIALSEAIPEPRSLRFDEQRFASLFWSDVRPLFSTIRDVRRFINVLRTTLNLLAEEVDLADIFALEALRLFEPTAFERILANRYLLTGTRDPFGDSYAYLMGKGEHADDKEKVEAISATSRQPSHVERIVKQLFPHAERHLGGPAYHGSISSEWKAACRVADGEVFDVYLHRRLAPGALPARDVERILGLFGDEEGLRRELGLLEGDQLTRLYTRLADYRGALSFEEVRIALTVVMDIGVGFGDSYTDMSGAVLVRQLLEAVEPGRALELVRDLSYPTLSRRYELIRAAGYQGDQREGMISETDTAALEGKLVSDLLTAEAISLVAEPDFAGLVGLLERQNREGFLDRVKDWGEQDVFLVRLVGAYAMEKVGERNQRIVQLNWFPLEEVLGAAGLRGRFEQIDLAWVEEEFSKETAILWEQALRYLDSPDDAKVELAGWPADLPPR
jgi:type II secretory pathway predicted ATPase ExeA